MARSPGWDVWGISTFPHVSFAVCIPVVQHCSSEIPVQGSSWAASLTSCNTASPLTISFPLDLTKTCTSTLKRSCSMISSCSPHIQLQLKGELCLCIPWFPTYLSTCAPKKCLLSTYVTSKYSLLNSKTELEKKNMSDLQLSQEGNRHSSSSPELSRTPHHTIKCCATPCFLIAPLLPLRLWSNEPLFAWCCLVLSSIQLYFTG